MSENKLEKLSERGQSVWLDSISRAMLSSGQLAERIERGVRGLTSNPTIFDKAISQTSDYDPEILKLAKSGRSTFEIYDELTTNDIRKAAELFLPVYERTHYKDGYVSLEVSPKLAYDAAGSIEEGRRLFKKVGMPNLMIKIPATKEGFSAVKALLAEGINVNATLMFAQQQYVAVAESFLQGLEKLKASGGDLSKTHSVASVFVSRIDTAVDQRIEDQSAKLPDEAEELKKLCGNAALCNAQVIFNDFLNLFSSQRFADLKADGAGPQRVLWASTSTKNPDYHDLKYVEGLIASPTVNTLPEATYEAFLDHGEVTAGLKELGLDPKAHFEALNARGIDINDVNAELLDQGVKAFDKSFDSLIASIEKKAEILV